MIRNFSDDQKKEFKKKSFAGKQEFRKQWAEMQVKMLNEKKPFTQSWRKVDVTKGTYESLRSPVGRGASAVFDDVVLCLIGC